MINHYSGLEDEFGDIIAKARIGLGMSIEELASASGVPASILQKCESYECLVDEIQCQKIAEALKLHPEKLLGILNNSWLPESFDLANYSVEMILTPHGGYYENCYVIGCPQSGLCAVVDPGGKAPEIFSRIRKNNWKLDLVLVTHGHIDHTGALSELLQEKPTIRLAANPAECQNMPKGLAARKVPAEDGMEIFLGKLKITALFTPGHTAGSTCYYAGDVCFVGDTLFAGSIGRPMNPEYYRHMLASIRNKVLALKDSVLILSGHGPVSTVGFEKAHNPFF